MDYEPQVYTMPCGCKIPEIVADPDDLPPCPHGMKAVFEWTPVYPRGADRMMWALTGVETHAEIAPFGIRRVID